MRLSLHLPHFNQGVEFSRSWPGVSFCLGDLLLFSLSERKQRWILVFTEPCHRGKWCSGSRGKNKKSPLHKWKWSSAWCSGVSRDLTGKCSDHLVLFPFSTACGSLNLHIWSMSQAPILLLNRVCFSRRGSHVLDHFPVVLIIFMIFWLLHNSSRSNPELRPYLENPLLSSYVHQFSL